MRSYELTCLAILAGACAGGAPEAAPEAAAPEAAAPEAVAPAGRAVSTPDSIEVAGVALQGTLLLPAPGSCPGPVPVALIIAGSGPTDRNGNSPVFGGDNNSLRLLAEGLAGACIASLRYDKRRIGRSAAAGRSEADLRFTTFADDASAWLRRLHADERFGDVVVIGHSEGATLGTLAAADAGAAGVVLIAGAGRPAGVILREQLGRQLPAALYAQADSALTELEAGRTVADPPPALFALLRPSIQPYLISWLRVDPAAELAALDVPALVVQGTTDAQVVLADAERLVASAGEDARLVVIEGMNHVLKVVPADDAAAQRASYSDPTLPLAPELVPAVADFIHGL